MPELSQPPRVNGKVVPIRGENGYRPLKESVKNLEQLQRAAATAQEAVGRQREQLNQMVDGHLPSLYLRPDIPNPERPIRDLAREIAATQSEIHDLFEKKRYRPKTELDTRGFAEALCDDTGRFKREKLDELNSNLPTHMSAQRGIGDASLFTFLQESPEFRSELNRLQDEDPMRSLAIEIETVLGVKGGVVQNDKLVTYLHLDPNYNTEELIKKAILRFQNNYKIDPLNLKGEFKVPDHYQKTLVQAAGRYIKEFDSLPMVQIHENEFGIQEPVLSYDITSDWKKAEKEAIGELHMQFTPDTRVTSELVPGWRSLVLSVSVGAMERAGLFKQGQGAQLLSSLEYEVGVANPTLTISIPVEPGQTDKEAISQLGARLVDEGAVVYRSGWFSKPEGWAVDEICDVKVNGKMVKTTLWEAHNQVIHQLTGKRAIMVGLAGIGCLDENGGTPGSRTLEMRMQEVGSVLDCGRDHQLRAAAQILSGTGIGVRMLIGHSRAGLEAEMAPESFFFGVPAHALNPAALLARTENSDDHDPHFRVRVEMSALDFLNRRFTFKPTGYIANLPLIFSPSAIMRIVGRIPGITERAWRTIGNRYERIMRSSNDRSYLPNQKAMELMSKGQGLPGDERVQKAEVKQIESTLLTTRSSGGSDYFVQTKELQARDEANYKYLLLQEGWLEDLGLTPNQIAQHPELLAGLTQQLFEAQTFHNAGGHHNFYDVDGSGGGYRDRLARFIFTNMRDRAYKNEDIALTAVLEEYPLVLQAELDQAKLSPWSLGELTDGDAHILHVSLAQYAKVKTLQKLIETDKGSSWDSYRKMKRAKILEKKDLSGVGVFLQNRLAILGADAVRSVEVKNGEIDQQLLSAQEKVRHFIALTDPHTDFRSRGCYQKILGFRTGSYVRHAKVLDQELQKVPLYQKLPQRDREEFLDRVVLDLLKTELISVGLKK